MRIDHQQLAKNGKRIVFGGLFFDVAGPLLTERSIARLKTAALLYDRVLVLDGSLHAYGPPFYYLRDALTNATPENVLGEFLLKGILVPAIRAGESIRENWKLGEYGAAGHLVLQKDEPHADLVLRYIDRCIEDSGLCTNWPSKLKPDAGPDLGRLLWRILGSPASPHALSTIGQSSRGIPPTASREWHNARTLLDAVLGVLEDGRDKPNFRRGEVEDAVAGVFGLNRLSYDEIAGKARANNALDYRVALHILDAVTTVQQAWHAVRFNIVPGLFPRHNPLIVDSVFWDLLQGTSSQELTGESRHIRREVVFAEGAFDAGNLTAKQIIAVREWPEFTAHKTHLDQIVYPRPGEAFEDLNRDFVQHLLRYLRKIADEFPQVGWIRETTKWAGRVSAVLQLITAPSGRTLLLGNEPMLTLPTLVEDVVLAAATYAAAELFAEPIDNVATRLRNRFLVGKAKQNYYRYWKSLRAN